VDKNIQDFILMQHGQCKTSYTLHDPFCIVFTMSAQSCLVISIRLFILLAPSQIYLFKNIIYVDFST